MRRWVILVAFHYFNKINRQMYKTRWRTFKIWSQIKTSCKIIYWQRRNKSTEVVTLNLCRRLPTLSEESTSGTPLSTGQDWANKRVSGSDGGDGHWWPLRDALLSALIVAMIILCGRSCWEAVGAYLQLSQKWTHSNKWAWWFWKSTEFKTTLSSLMVTT